MSSTTGSNEVTNMEVQDMTKFMMETKVEGGKSIWATTLETFGMHDGKKKKDDILCDTFEEAFNSFLDMAKNKDWQFASTPFKDFKATKEDLFKAFVHWSRKSEDDETHYNPSKGFRRLEEYVKWMDNNGKGLEYNITGMKKVHDAWKSKITHDKQGRLVWWIDVGALDFKFIKTIPPNDTLSYFVWFSHLVLFDKSSQENGFVVVESMGHAGMMESMTAISMDVSTKLDRLTIGVLPIKMESCIIFNNPTWIRIVMALMTPFMGKKMRKRIVMLPNKTHPQAYFDETLGKENIPVDFAQLEGTIGKDIAEDMFDQAMSVITDEVET